MTRSFLFLSFAVGLLLATTEPAGADSPPPRDAMPLSQILQALEKQGVAWFEEIEWDDDGHWEIEYVSTGDKTVKVRIDPVTGKPRTRR